MEIYNNLIDRKQITNMDEWFKYAPPASGKGHWKKGRSAMESAKFWTEKQKVEKIQNFIIDKGFPASFKFAVPEFCGVFDPYKNPRKHDLVIFTADNKSIITIESKADESFGDNSLLEEIRNSINEKIETPNSRKFERTINLFSEYFLRNSASLNLMYQLTYWFAASINQAQMLGIEKILMLNQFFYSARLNQKKISKNSKDFDSFVSFISKEKFKSIEDDTIKGPILNEYTRGIELYVGKYKVNLS